MQPQATPGRASFAGLASHARQSPSFRDIARLIVPTDREKVLKQAIPNAAAMLIVVFILVTLYAINVVLMPFLRPLLLALLFGSFLHPLKRSLALFFKQILTSIRKHDRPFLAGLLLPLSTIDQAVELLRTGFCHYLAKIFNLAKTIIHGDIRSALAVCLAAMAFLIIGGDSLLNFVVCINLMIFVTDITKSEVSFSDAYLQFLIRSFGFVQICWFSSLYVLIPIVFIWIACRWLLYKLLEKFSGSQQENNESPDTLEENAENEDDNSDKKTASELDALIETSQSSFIGFHQMFIDQLEGYVDTISSACVIGLIALIVIFTTLYLSFQIYSESVYMLEKLSIFANTIINNNPDLKSLLPDGLTGVHGLLEGAMKNTYQHGREWIKKSTRQLLSNAALDEFNSTQSTLIEKQMVEFWDRAYDLWLGNRTNGTISLEDRSRKPYDWDKLFHALQSLNFTLCAQIFKQNWDTLVALVYSVTKVLKGNLSIFLGSIWAALSLLIVGGNVLMNFIIDLIIFTTALFYLLCASQDQYKPIEIIKSFMPSTTIRIRTGNSQRNEILNSVDQSINAVFTASLKMMTFHGLSTWLLHRMFELDVVYIPAALSAVFGAVPFISPYWASVPACIDLWMSGHVSQAVLMLLLATIPSSFVTTSFYSEIKGTGHPYLTGLAIAGGVFVFGIEGALFGPMLLVSIRLLSLFVLYLMEISR